MELIWNELALERVIYSGTAQALVEGSLPLPEGRAISEVLSASGKVDVTESSVEHGIVSIAGDIMIELICSGDGVFAFSSKASFRHTISAEGAVRGMTAQVFPALQTIDVTLENGIPSLSAVIDLRLRVTDQSPVRMLEGISGADDIEKKTEQLCVSNFNPLITYVARLRNEIDAPFAAAVLHSEVTAMIREIHSDGSSVTIDGTLSVSALIRGKDGMLSQLTQNIPFSEALDEATPMEVFGTVTITSHDMRASEDFGLVVVETQLSIALFVCSNSTITLTADAFSPSMPFACTQNRMQVCTSRETVTHRHSLSESIMVPSGMPEIQRMVYACARPLITSQVIEDGMLAVEGLFFTRILYTAESGRMYAFSEDIPFSLSLPAGDATEAMLSACATVSASGSGKSVDANYVITIFATLYRDDPVYLVNGIDEHVENRPMHGIIVYYAGAGETLYDVAKRFCTSRARLRGVVTDLDESLEEGQRIVFLN